MRFAFMAAAVVCCTLCQHSLAPSQSTPPLAKDSERLVYVIPNNLSIEHQTAFAPISTRTKFRLSAADVFDWYAFAAAGVNAGVEQATKVHPQYGQGAVGFAKRYGADFADEATSEFLGDAVFSSLFHQDPRYFRLEHGGIWKRSWYALTRSVVTRDDIGELEFNGSVSLVTTRRLQSRTFTIQNPNGLLGRQRSAEAFSCWKIRRLTC